MWPVVLVGGPYDGAEGPLEIAGCSPLWVVADPQSKGRNGLLASDVQQPGRARYVLNGTREDGTLLYDYGDLGNLGRLLTERERELMPA